MTDIFFIIFSGKSFMFFFFIIIIIPSLKCVFYVSWYFVQWIRIFLSQNIFEDSPPKFINYLLVPVLN